jgi:hypothetical protein
LRFFHFGRMKTAFHWGRNENLSEMLRTIRKRLQSIMACIFALRKLDKGKQMASTSKIRRKKEEKPRNPKKLVNVWESPFGKMLRDPDSSLESTAAGKLFRLRVRVPFSVYQMIVDKFRTIPEWDIYKDSSSKRGRPHPLELKVMASLYILGRAATYDDAAMVTYLSSTVIATFFHHFIVCMATLYPQWIYPTPEGPKLEDVLKQYETLGFPGCCASTDCVHIPWNNCPQGERHLYYSRYGFTSVAYSVSVDHSRRILSVTTGHPGTRNDKTIIQFDKFIQNLRSGVVYPNAQFDLFNESGGTVRISGLYALCDGGYHKWRVLQCPNKYATAEFEARWSKRIESVRKDVECTFGILKRRFRTLKVPMQYWAKEDVDNIMFTCCVLHNILLEHDAWEWTVQDDTDDVELPSFGKGVAGRSDVTDFSYMSGPDNNIPVEECETEGSSKMVSNETRPQKNCQTIWW